MARSKCHCSHAAAANIRRAFIVLRQFPRCPPAGRGQRTPSTRLRGRRRAPAPPPRGQPDTGPGILLASLGVAVAASFVVLGRRLEVPAVERDIAVVLKDVGDAEFVTYLTIDAERVRVLPRGCVGVAAGLNASWIRRLVLASSPSGSNLPRQTPTRSAISSRSPAARRYSLFLNFNHAHAEIAEEWLRSFALVWNCQI